MTKETKKVLDRETKEYIDDLVKSLQEGMRALTYTTASVVQPIKDSEAVINKITQSGKVELIDTLVSIHKVILNDMELYGPKVSKIHAEVVSHLDKLPTRPRHVQAFVANSLYLGQSLIELNSTILETTFKVTEDYFTLLKEAGIE